MLVANVILSKAKNLKNKKTKNVLIKDTGSGKDTYKVTKSEKVTITEGGSSEISGNDKYVFTDSKVTVSDYLGNDKYKINGGDNISTVDEKGNDTYKATAKSGHEINTLSVIDKSGKDKYTVSGSKKTKKAEAVYVKGLNIADSGAILTDAQGKEIAKSANDVYKLSYIDNTGDLYNNYKIADTAGDDKYTISNSKKISVEDNAGNDQYTITSITDTFNLVDSLGNDKYTLKNIDNLTLTDNSGSDKYTLKNVANLTLTDNLGSDKYAIDKITGKYTIQDKATGGADLASSSNDSLIISDKKAKIIFMANVSTDGTALYAYDTKNGGYIKINNYYKASENSLVDDGDGKIETIKVGKNTISVTSATDMNIYSQEITSFIGEGKTYATIEAALNATDNQTTIAALVAAYNK